MATHPNILAWEILWTEESGRLQSIVLQKVGHDSATKPPPPTMIPGPGTRHLKATSNPKPAEVIHTSQS